MKEYKFENATVRIHEGKRTEEERRQALEEAAKRFMMKIEKIKDVKRNESA